MGQRAKGKGSVEKKPYYIYFLFVMVILYACTPQGIPNKPTVKTGKIINITATTASCTSKVKADGGQAVTVRGVCWSIAKMPQVSNSKTTDSIGLGEFTSILSDLLPSTTYYVRAYATNANGTAYGEQRSFTTQKEPVPEFGSFTDSRDGKVYKTVTIGEQVWMAENLAYLPKVYRKDEGSGSYEEYPYYYVYDYDGRDVAAAKATSNYQTYGVLYNWAAGLSACPPGWHLPSDGEWKQLEMYLGMKQEDADDFVYRGTDEGGKMKEKGINHWNTPNTGATNKSGFTGLPGGYRINDGDFRSIGYYSFWWSSTEMHISSYIGITRELNSRDSRVYRGAMIKGDGLSIRCIGDHSPLTITTGQVLNITTTTATCTGNVTADGDAAIIARGVCWGTSQLPTISDSKSSNGVGLGVFSGNITGLSPNTTYYVRAYATNSKGTAYGEQKPFRTYNTFTDSRDGHVYKFVTIGSQDWMAENLAYLPSVSPPTREEKNAPYYYVYDYNGTSVTAAKTTSNYQTYGVLYNWTAAMTACPEDWHVPSDAEWTTLSDYLGGLAEAGGKMKEAGTTHWHYPNMLATNESGFTALPGGYCYYREFLHIFFQGYWWSSTEVYTDYRRYWNIIHCGGSLSSRHNTKNFGYSVRCVRD
ncbi:MAG: FISUMP domain-containing protein [Petrimonas sp.]|nr:FISUMP domain-containing protein [Petrimonas sp.]MDD3542990.1 FISUMP domain-containing protein [Petrimonas sp.]